MAETITGELLKEALEKTEKVINKNNLSEAVTTLLQNQSFIIKVMIIEREERKERKNTSTHLLRVAYGAAISAVVVALINGIVWFFNILPVLREINR